MAKVTAYNLVRAINNLPKNVNYNYINPSTKGLIRIENVILPAGPIMIRRWNPNKGESWNSANVESISSEMIWRVANAFIEKEPINFDRVLGGSYNTRSVLETLIALTPEFYYCYPGRIKDIEGHSSIERGHKHLIWLPETPHAAGHLVEKAVPNMAISEIPSQSVTYDNLIIPPDYYIEDNLVEINVIRRHTQIQIAESSAYALKGGIEIFHRNGTEVPDVLSGSEQNIEGIQRSEAEYGRKSILNRQTKAHLADDEVLRNAEEYRTGGRIKWGGADRNAELIQRKAAKSTLNRYESPKTAEIIQQRRREYVIKRLRESKSGRGFVRSSVAGSQRLGRNVADRMGKILKGTVTSAKTLFNSLTAGGAAALLVVVIMVVFGAAFTFTEDGNQIVGTGDDAIVEVAKAELGNVGGDKFWKWYGFTSHVDWCAIFCSWCADQCGYIEAGILPKFSVVGDGASWFKARHRWSGRGYSPKPGDFIFFDFEQDGVLDHVGIVESCDGKVVTTIEGNSGNVCKRLSYRVGSASIAGYGLMIRPSGNKARQLALKAINLAYPDAPDKAKYHGGEPTAAYAAALNRAYPNRSGWGQPSKDGASCDVFVGTCIVDSGVDKGFPRGYRDQKTRLASRTDLYECVVSTTSSDVKESELKDGDIVTWEKSSGTVHIFIYAGGKARHAAHDKWYGRTTAVGNNLKISGKTMLMYGKEASNRKQEIDRQHYTIPNQRPKDKHCGKI